MSRVRVLYLAGSGRSGSTLVTTVLGQLPGCFAAGELRYLWQRGICDNRPCGCGLPFGQCPLWTKVVGDLPPVDAARVAGGLRTRLRLRGLPALLRRHRAGRAGVPAHPDDEVVAALYTALAVHAGTDGGPPVIVDSSKLPPYGALLDGLPEIDLRVLHVVRDPRATAFSWRRRRPLDGAAGDGRLMSRPPIAKAALLWLVWNAATLRLWGSRQPDRYLRVRYEDFVADPVAVTGRIARFAGLDDTRLPFTGPHAVRLDVTHSVAGNPARHRVGVVPVTDDSEWIGGLSRGGFLVASALALPLLRRLGYPARRPEAREG